MDEYINRGLALEAKIPHYSANGVEIIVSEAIPVEYIEKLPAADVRPVVRGQWENTGSDVWKCSACGYGIMPWNAGVNFCPNCGADMREQPKEEQI